MRILVFWRRGKGESGLVGFCLVLVGDGEMVTLAFFFEGQLALFVVVFIFAATTVFASLKGEEGRVSCLGGGSLSLSCVRDMVVQAGV